MFKAFKERKKRVANYKIYWYKLIPFVIAEISNPEWESLQPLIRENKISSLSKMYNKNGNWYVLEGLDYFFLGRNIYTRDGFLFSDSLKFYYIELKTDKLRWDGLIEEAKSNIDEFYKDLLKIFKIK